MDREKGISTGTPEDLALSGYLSGFFARKGIVFDMETGLFRIDNPYDKKIRLVGDGRKYAMVRKALLRNGFYAGSEIESENWIDAGDTATSAITLCFRTDSSGRLLPLKNCCYLWMLSTEIC